VPGGGSVNVDVVVDNDCVTDETWQRLSRRWGPGALVSWPFYPDFYRMVSDVLNSLGVHVRTECPGGRPRSQEAG
jgi:hypothetical protein